MSAENISPEGVSDCVTSTLVDMFTDRNYSSVEKVDSVTVLSDESVGLVVKPDDLRYKIGIQDIRQISEEYPGRRIITATHGGATPYAAAHCSEMIDVPTEFFSVGELYRNITRHSLVPRHVKISEQEAQCIIDKYGLKDKNAWPRMLVTDPVSRYFNYECGDIIKIYRANVRSNGSVCADITYRRVHSD